jgi:hypothetical protein
MYVYACMYMCTVCIVSADVTDGGYSDTCMRVLYAYMQVCVHALCVYASMRTCKYVYICKYANILAALCEYARIYERVCSL